MSDKHIRLRFADRFLKQAKHLEKKYRHVQDAIRSVTERLKAGETLGDRVHGVTYIVYKVRVQNTDAAKGKSGGYRVLYYIKTEERIILLTIYSKSEQNDISTDEIVQIIEQTMDDESDDAEP